MSEDSTPKTPHLCPSCGEPVADDTPAGLCPKCVLGAAAQPTGSGDDALPHQRFDAPDIDDIAKAFPTLEILELIGCGGMGAVYKARQPHLDREVALKILPHSLAETPEFTERFSREGRLLARLNHPNIVGVYDFGETGGYFFLLMEFVDGVNLRQAMKAGKFAPDQALEIVPEVCQALQFAHNEGILHRDIKPENILLDTRGRVKIADFGIAKMVGEVGPPTITRTAAPGTPQYMAPEQIERPGDVDHRADIYSLGVVFYEMLTGELPIGRFAAPSEISAVGSAVDEIVFRALEKERDRRQQSADEVRTEISGVPTLSASPATELRDSRHEKMDRRIHSGKALRMTAAGVFFPLIVLFLGAVVSDFEKSKLNWEMHPINAVHNRVINLPYHTERRLEAAEEGLPADAREISRLRNELNIVKAQKALFENRKDQRSNGLALSTIPALIAWWALLPICAIPTTVLGWRQLRRLKLTQNRRGRIPSLIAAGFWPMVGIIVVISLMVLLLSKGNADYAAVGWIIILSITAGCGSVFLLWKWLNHPPTSDQQQRFQQLEEKPWEQPAVLNRFLLLAVLILGLVTLILILVSGILFEGREQANLLLPCAFLSALAIFAATACIAKLVNGCYFPVKESPQSSQNPWPRRIFWMIALAILVPMALIAVSVATPELAQRASASPEYFRGLHGIGIGPAESGSDFHAIELTTFLRKSDNMAMEVRLVYEGPKTLESSGGVNRLNPGHVIEWTIRGGGSELRRIEFAVPDESVHEEMFAQLAQFKEKVGPAVLVPDVRRLDLFQVRVGKIEYRAMLEIEIVAK